MKNYKARVIGGEFAKRYINVPNHTEIRPTTDALKESIFNIIEHNFYMDFKNTNAIDICAGSGGLGIEALSRGSAECVFVDNNIVAINCIIHNIKQLHIEDKSHVLKINSFFITEKILEYFIEKKDLIIFLDPPYRMKNLLFDVIKKLFSFDRNMLCVVESDNSFELDNSFYNIDISRKYGNRVVSFLTHKSTRY
ncbi:MAG: 16S rRNA (guanine(966)-N(2))-methyltransferase RsmD [Holosporales bacterium]|jgi:16S rRNA (guanine(966)-N(2))-methyltransferase RsmD|nr:16S rRNA (guanine(966)-N(2))-methyltransferase RsmD [Holosporales bacterium]